MKKEDYFKIPEYNRLRLNKAMDIVSRFMTSKKDNLSEYKLSILDRISGYYCSSTHPEEVKNGLEEKKYIDGECSIQATSPDSIFDPIIEKLNILTRKTKLYSCMFLNDIKFEDDFEILWLTVHEVNHTDTLKNAYIDLLSQSIYYGFSKINMSPLSKNSNSGEGIDEFVNELYTQVPMYMNYPEKFKNTKSIDELIYSFPQKLGSPSYNELGYIAKLLLLVCDNDLTVSYESLMNTDEPFVEKIVDLNGIICYKNDLIYTGKHNRIEFEKHFDGLCNKKGLFEKLLINFDVLLEEIGYDEPLTEEALSNILQIIDLYKTRKYDLMEAKGFWSKEKREYHEKMYSSYREYITNIGYTLPLKRQEEIINAVLSLKNDEKEKASN
ncbi:MAG: hypothetical protein IKZ96_00075 [Bacilli bacterium]|nr:hypothetical protein [Bacilli bacterium]